MKEIHTEIGINASAETVWRVLTDFERYPEWNPLIRRGAGDVRVGARLRVYIEPSQGRGMSIRPTVLVADPNRELRWVGRLWVPGLVSHQAKTWRIRSLRVLLCKICFASSARSRSV